VLLLPACTLGWVTFLQIFEFLDQDGLGSFNLVSLIMQQPEWLNELNDEVGVIGQQHPRRHQQPVHAIMCMPG
jgi:hypothetical protein